MNRNFFRNIFSDSFEANRSNFNYEHTPHDLNSSYGSFAFNQGDLESSTYNSRFTTETSFFDNDDDGPDYRFHSNSNNEHPTSSRLKFSIKLSSRSTTTDQAFIGSNYRCCYCSDQFDPEMNDNPFTFDPLHYRHHHRSIFDTPIVSLSSEDEDDEDEKDVTFIFDDTFDNGSTTSSSNLPQYSRCNHRQAEENKKTTFNDEYRKNSSYIPKYYHQQPSQSGESMMKDRRSFNEFTTNNGDNENFNSSNNQKKKKQPKFGKPRTPKPSRRSMFTESPSFLSDSCNWNRTTDSCVTKNYDNGSTPDNRNQRSPEKKRLLWISPEQLIINRRKMDMADIETQKRNITTAKNNNSTSQSAPSSSSSSNESEETKNLLVDNKEELFKEWLLFKEFLNLKERLNNSALLQREYAQFEELLTKHQTLPLAAPSRNNFFNLNKETTANENSRPLKRPPSADNVKTNPKMRLVMMSPILETDYEESQLDLSPLMSSTQL